MAPHSPAVVSVAFPIAAVGLFDYEIPAQLRDRIAPGMPVLVELKNRRLWGVAIRLKETSSFPKLKQVLDTAADRWTDHDRSLIRLYEWIASYYQTDLGKIFKPFLKKGLLTGQTKTKPRDAAAPDDTVHATPPSLTEEQMRAVGALKREMASPGRPCLLHGITGSGKTLVYIELVKEALAAGKGVIILVPEISLTPQTIRRFEDALGPVITVIHSRMSEGERRESLDDLVSGRKRAIIGVRSAILSPLHAVGLVIVDEEHDGSYKQSDMEPRYNARDVAVMRAHLQKALVVLGSATPSFESYRNALTGKYLLLTLTRRFGAAALPRVEIADMRTERLENNWTMLSRTLHCRISEALAQGRQVILLLNRRGFSTFLLCKDCGHAYTCPNCSVNLIYHKAGHSAGHSAGHDLKCHQCGYGEPAPSKCPKCQGEQIQFKGTGIQKAEEYIRQQFPEGRVVRMDQDTTRRKGAHLLILEKFARREADILIGTQMVAKGLNFPGVALVGIVQADIGLHFPDFRASEKTFQLLAQAAGRAGREDSSGEVIIQTYCPDEAGIVSAGGHDYIGFYNKEIAARERLGYPPFGKLVRIVVQGEAEADVSAAAGALARDLRGLRMAQCALLGPSPAVFSRIKNNYRYCMLLKSKSTAALQEMAGHIKKNTALSKKGVKIIIDVDPLNML